MIYIARIKDNQLLSYTTERGFYFHKYVTKETKVFEDTQEAESALVIFCHLMGVDEDDYRLAQD